MDEWQLGPPLLVGDRVVHLGEVVIVMMLKNMCLWGGSVMIDNAQDQDQDQDQ